MQLNSDEERKEVPAAFNYVMGPFHRDEITGLDVCIRKELIATCSKDRSVSIWNYATRTHELSHTWQEECLAVAFHPSGLHLIVAFGDKISVCNILSNKIAFSKTIPTKNCYEIKFSNGGHLFACAAKCDKSIKAPCCFEVLNCFCKLKQICLPAIL